MQSKAKFLKTCLAREMKYVMNKGAYFLDKCQMPCIRTKFDKANFFVS